MTHIWKHYFRAYTNIKQYPHEVECRAKPVIITCKINALRTYLIIIYVSREEIYLLRYICIDDGLISIF